LTLLPSDIFGEAVTNFSPTPISLVTALVLTILVVSGDNYGMRFPYLLVIFAISELASTYVFPYVIAATSASF
jgi:hypothetical protein